MICGCELLMPETAIFEDAKIKIIMKTDKDGCITQYKQKFTLQKLRQDFSIIARDRKKDGQTGFDKDDPETQQTVESKIFYKDSAIIRYNDK